LSDDLLAALAACNCSNHDHQNGSRFVADHERGVPNPTSADEGDSVKKSPDIRPIRSAPDMNFDV
jgi:hypothetical protein